MAKTPEEIVREYQGPCDPPCGKCQDQINDIYDIRRAALEEALDICQQIEDRNFEDTFDRDVLRAGAIEVGDRIRALMENDREG